MGKFLGLVFGGSRLTSIFGYILGVPGIYTAVQAFGSGQHIDIKALVASIALTALGRFSSQEKPAVMEAK